MQTALMPVRDWGVAEFGRAELQDQRRSRRLIKVAARAGANPQGALPQSFSVPSELQAGYRLLETDDVTREAIMAPHITRVREECRQPGDYLFVEDTTELNFTSHPAAEELGLLGDGGGRGMFVHSSLVLQISGWNWEKGPQV